jgi:hypothetical protein
VLDYLARYVSRIAITNTRILGLDDTGLRIQYRDRKTPASRQNAYRQISVVSPRVSGPFGSRHEQPTLLAPCVKIP